MYSCVMVAMDVRILSIIFSNAPVYSSSYINVKFKAQDVFWEDDDNVLRTYAKSVQCAA